MKINPLNRKENLAEIQAIVTKASQGEYKVYPIVKAGTWDRLDGEILQTTAIKGDNENDSSKIVAVYGIDTPDGFVYLTMADLEIYDGTKLLDDAYKNLDDLESVLEYAEALNNKALISIGSYFASERVFSKVEMSKAHAMLESEELFVSTSVYGELMIISQHADKDTKDKFAYLHKYNWNDDENSNERIADLVYSVKNGAIVGHIPL
ncbi:hypothetical protein [Olleya sp. HaHaR_3_96]|uniref:hypothetical protein n=1 Tax=Olleya sp. HaHaR_3_96 TaxID=2745560 RepID=UPI001C4EFA65|nr:hypothetical protein [Olleya sp. HaHaR_3_96]QXP59970.1 hypothetical protein H0I26_19015 [Olleya sp. HaHaR_3_96]